MRRPVKIVAGLAVASALIFTTASSCGSDNKGTPAQQERKSNSTDYAAQVANQPGHSMGGYSPTRRTINFWIDTWKKPNKLSYVYLIASNGQLVGYYILEGLPVTMCAALKPTWTYEETPNDDSAVKDQRVPAASADGVYYSGGQCSDYYGKDANTGAYIEFSTGSGINFLAYDQPLPRQDVEPLGFTTVENVRK